MRFLILVLAALSFSHLSFSKSPSTVGPFDEEEAKIISAFVAQMLADLPRLARSAIPHDTTNASHRGLWNSAQELHLLLRYLQANPRNHLRNHFYNVNPWAMRNWMELASPAHGWVLKRFADAVVNGDPLRDLLNGIKGTTRLETLPSNAERNPVDLGRVSEQEWQLTETYALVTVAVGLQSLSASLAVTWDEPVTASRALSLVRKIRNGLELLASRNNQFARLVALYEAVKPNAFELRELKAAAALVAHLGTVFIALTYLEQGFAQVDAPGGLAPFTVNEGVRYLYELVTALRFPPFSLVGIAQGPGPCLGELDVIGGSGH